jgi:hypothetical protein
MPPAGEHRDDLIDCHSGSYRLSGLVQRIALTRQQSAPMESSLLRVFRRASVRWSTLADTSALAMDERAGQWRKSWVAVAILIRVVSQSVLADDVRLSRPARQFLLLTA